MLYQLRDVSQLLLVIYSFCLILFASFLFGKLAKHLIYSKSVSVPQDQVSIMAINSCKVDINGIFKYENTGSRVPTRESLKVELKLINNSGNTFLPGREFKLGLRWQGPLAPFDQYRIELPNKIAPEETLSFVTRISLKEWANLNDILTIELMNEGAFWCSDYGGVRLVLTRDKKNNEISVKNH